jgi:predicted MFS family arabinose efflux permease
MSNDDAVEQLNKNITIFSLIVIGTLGIMAFQVMPAFVMGMISDLKLSDSQIGKVASAQLIGIALGSFLNLYLIKKLSWRRIATLGVSLLLLMDFISIFLSGFAPFVVIRLLAGTAGGICVSFGAFGLANTLKADKNFGYFMIFQVFSAIVGILFLSVLVQRHGIICIYIFLIAVELLALLVLLKNIPNMEVAEHEKSEGNNQRIWVLCFLQLAAILFFFFAIGGFWTYIAPIGLAAGLSEAETGRAISLGLFGGLAGSFVATHLNIRIGRLLPILFAVGTQFIALAILYSGFDFTVFMLGAGLFMFGWYMFFPYQLGLLAALDRDGRPMILANAVAGIGSGFGPLILAFFLLDGYLPAYIFSGGFLFLALSLTTILVFISKRDLKTE